ncbi:hypothetical protein VTK73DRAFT_7441 [Phialemonium thermophilum]|uniref:GPI mannosyltransferase 1 n=1 Tax=Phialemonium thermophilum TaxID=223376 RepID=A0ABR3WED3_9PEZI
MAAEPTVPRRGPAAQKTAGSGPSVVSSFFARPAPLYIAAALLRVVLLLYGLWQDAHSPVKYTDIDYLVFTDAARFVARGDSPYDRETYRYTPLLAWLLLPTTWSPAFWFSFGKVVFAAADLAAGRLIEQVLVTTTTTRMSTPASKGGSSSTSPGGMDPATARRFAAVWLLNPMVATISTRGSSEGLLGVLVVALLWAVLARRLGLAALLLGFAVHFKIYPFIYAPAIVWWMDDERLLEAEPSTAGRRKARRGVKAEEGSGASAGLAARVLAFLTPARIRLAAISLGTFTGLNLLMLSIYGTPFLTHTYFHHVTRIDHRHNFSPYHIQLYWASASPPSSSAWPPVESLAFLPQLLLSCVLIPLVLAKKDLPTSMLAQTFAFVTFNKVCTSQYFLWYMVLLPLYLPRSAFLRRPLLGLAALGLWVAGQALWLREGFRLEFLGRSTFMPGLWLSCLAFFLINCWILGVIVADVEGEEVEEVKRD